MLYEVSTLGTEPEWRRQVRTGRRQFTNEEIEEINEQWEEIMDATAERNARNWEQK